MIFIALNKFKEKPNKEMIAKIDRQIEKMSKKGIKFINMYWTLGRFDAVAIFEAPDEKAAMKMGLMVADVLKTQTLVAVPRKEALKLLD
jgi:uncharacterized protein with GYD domain